MHTIEEREQYKSALYDTIEHSSRYPEGRFRGRGIVTVAGGQSYLAGAWASFSILRAMKVDLPMQLWFFGEGEFDNKTRALFSEIGVECVDIQKVLKENPAKNLSPEYASQRRFALFEMKCYSILHSPFEEVLFLDADDIALRDFGQTRRTVPSRQMSMLGRRVDYLRRMARHLNQVSCSLTNDSVGHRCK
jgi:hypothetical protein